MNIGPVDSGLSDCVGGIFDMVAESNIPAGPGTPGWVVGGTFLKNVCSVFPASPPSVLRRYLHWREGVDNDTSFFVSGGFE